MPLGEKVMGSRGNIRSKIWNICFKVGNIKKIRGLDVFVGSNGKNVVFVKMFFRVEGHIIIFKEEIGEVVVDASTSQLHNSLFLCPKASEGDLGIRS